MTAAGFSPSVPEPLEDFAVQFDPVLHLPAQRPGFRAYFCRTAAAKDRNKTLTALAGAEPFVEAQAAAVQRLPLFRSEARWEGEAVNAQRLALLAEQPALASHPSGALLLHAVTAGNGLQLYLRE